MLMNKYFNKIFYETRNRDKWYLLKNYDPFEGSDTKQTTYTSNNKYNKSRRKP